MHSDGQIQPILPDLVEIGLTVLNPVQPEVLNHRTLRRDFDGQLAYLRWDLDPDGAAPRLAGRRAPGCGRRNRRSGAGRQPASLLAPSHRMMADIPLANVDALLDAFRVTRP